MMKIYSTPQKEERKVPKTASHLEILEVSSHSNIHFIMEGASYSVNLKRDLEIKHLFYLAICNITLWEFN